MFKNKQLINRKSKSVFLVNIKEVCLTKEFEECFPLMPTVAVCRSLVALSLILSLLRFNPAPLYILDEVDAALDLSHTQNIGQMLKTHFRSSQVTILPPPHRSVSGRREG